jgi:hypothetical protein
MYETGKRKKETGNERVAGRGRKKKKKKKERENKKKERKCKRANKETKGAGRGRVACRSTHVGSVWRVACQIKDGRRAVMSPPWNNSNSSRAGQGRAGQGRAGQGRAGQGQGDKKQTRADRVCIGQQQVVLGSRG